MLTVSTQIAREDDLGIFAQMLESVSFADTITIYSFGRSDKELKTLADKYKASIVMLKEPLPKIVEVIRAREIREAEGDWVLVMDFDEVVTPALAREIKQAISNGPHIISLYAIPRHNFSLGFPIAHAGFGGDVVQRLIRRSDFLDWPTDIHSAPQVKGQIKILENHMNHYKDASISQMVDKTNRYSDIEAEQFYRGGMAPVTAITLIRKPVMEFIRRYFLKRGFLDGRIGLLQSIYQGYSVFISYAKLFERQQKRKHV